MAICVVLKSGKDFSSGDENGKLNNQIITG
jgi:hypothetical protein